MRATENGEGGRPAGWAGWIVLRMAVSTAVVEALFAVSPRDGSL